MTWLKKDKERLYKSNRYQMIAKMMDFACENDIIEMEDLLIYTKSQRFGD